MSKDSTLTRVVIWLVVLIALSAYVSAWWSGSYSNRMSVNCNNTPNTTIVVNGSMGFTLTGDSTSQIVWTRCNSTTAIFVYYNSYSDYALGTDTEAWPFEVEVGNVSSYNVSQVWPSNLYVSVWHGAAYTDSLGLNNLSVNGTVNIINNGSCRVGKCFQFPDASSYLQNNLPTNLPSNQNATNLQVWCQKGSIGTTSGDAVMMAYGTAATATQQYLVYYNNDTYFGRGGANYATLTKQAPKLWRFVAGSRPTGTSGTLYTDTSSATGSQTTAVLPVNLRIGTGITTNNAPYGQWGTNDYGYIDEVRIMNISVGWPDLNQTYQNILSTAGFGTLGASESGGSPGTPPRASTAQNTPPNGYNTSAASLYTECAISMLNDTITSFNINIYSVTNGARTAWQTKNFATNQTNYNWSFTMTNAAFYNFSWNCNLTTLSGITNSSPSYWNFTYDGLAPRVTIQQPANMSIYSSSTLLTLKLNYTVYDAYLDKCRYSYDGGAYSSPLACTNQSLEDIDSGRHNVTVWVNDTFGNNATNITFFRVGNVTSNMTNGNLTNSSNTLNVLVSFNFGGVEAGNCNVISNSSIISCTGPGMGPGAASVVCTVGVNNNASVQLYPQCLDTDGFKFNGTAVNYDILTLVNATFSLTQIQPDNLYKTNKNSINLSCNITQLNQTINYLDINLWQGTTLVNRTRWNSTGAANYSWCYQETANVSASCGGGAGSYDYNSSLWFNGQRVIDGNWSNYGQRLSVDAPIYINYSKPDSSVNGIWQVESGGNYYNLTINSSCWSGFTDRLRFRIDSLSDGGAVFYCYSDATTKVIMFNASGLFIHERIHEEAMWWNISSLTSYQDNRTFTASPTLSSDGTYSWDCVAQSITGLNTRAGNRTFTRNTVNPSLTFIYPSELETFSSTASPYNITLKYLVSDDINEVSECWYYMNGGSIVTLPSCANVSIGSISYTDVNLDLYVNDTYTNSYHYMRNFSFGTIASANLTEHGAINAPFNISYWVDIGEESVNCTILANESSILNCTSPVTDFSGKISCVPYPELDGRYTLWMTCKRTNGLIYNTTRTSLYFDTTAPVISLASFNGSGQSFKARNLTGQWNWTDSNLFRINVSIDGIPIYQESDINVTSYGYRLNRDVKNLSLGTHNLTLQMWDSHTASAIADYEVSAPILSSKLTFETGTNRISIDAVDQPIKLFNPFTTQKEVDRYTFDYKPDDVQNSYTFEVKTEQPIHIVNKPNMKYKVWIVSGSNWVDFYTPNTPDNIVSIVKLNDYTARVTVSSPTIKEPIKEPVELSDEMTLEFASVGDLNVVQVSYTFYTYNATMTYLTSTEETQTQTPKLTIYKGDATYTAHANFTFGGVAKTVNSEDANVCSPFPDCQYVTYLNSTFNSPTLPAGTTTAVYVGNWTADINGEATWFNFTQTVMRVAIDNCSNYTNKVIKVTIYDENIPTSALVASMEVELEYGVSGSSTKTTNLGMTGSSTYYICLENETSNLTTNIYMKYTVPAGFTHRYYLVDYNLTGKVQQNLSIYNFNTTTGISLFQATTRDYYTNLYWANSIAKLQRYYVSEGVWRTVQMDKTDAFGLAVFHILEQTTDYRLLFYTNNTLVKQTDTVRFACTDAVCSSTILLKEPSTTTDSTYLNYSYAYNQNTGQIVIGWNDPLAGTSTVKLVVKKQTYTGTQTLCNTSQTGAAGTITCNTSGYTGATFVSFEGNSEGLVSEYLDLNSTSLSNSLGATEGAFWAVIIMLACVGFGVISPAVAIITMFIGLLAIYFLGIFTPLSVTFLIISAVLGIFIGFKVRS